MQAFELTPRLVYAVGTCMIDAHVIGDDLKPRSTFHIRLAHRLVRLIDRNLAEPRAHARLPPKPWERDNRRHERLLEHVFDVGQRTKQPRQQALQVGRTSLEYRAERNPIPAPARIERGVVRCAVRPDGLGWHE